MKNYCHNCGMPRPNHRDDCNHRPLPHKPASEGRIDSLFKIVENLTDRVVELERNEAARENYIAEQNEKAT